MQFSGDEVDINNFETLIRHFLSPDLCNYQLHHRGLVHKTTGFY